jgi:hypothetical protein
MTQDLKNKPGELVIGTSADRILVRIQTDGTLEYGPDYTPDEAAQVFWQEMARQRADFEAKDILTRHLEGLLKKLGAQDLRYEQCQRAASGPEASDHDRFQEERARGQLEAYVHQVIEIARGLALRDQVNEAERTPPSELN